jgi:hypothetical protein
MWFIVILAIALLASTAAYFLIRKASGGRLVSLAGALIVLPTSAYLSFVLIRDCHNSTFLKSNLEKGLSPSELVTLKPDGMICPAGYTFVRDGKVHTAILVEGLFRSKIFIGNDTSP